MKLMKLCLNDLKEKGAWDAAGIAVPGYDPAAVAERTRKEPLWIHFGAGNIFRIFIGGLADRLLTEGALESGVTVCQMVLKLQKQQSTILKRFKSIW